MQGPRRLHVRVVLVMALGLLAAGAAGCEDTTPVCRPASVASCWCNTGGPGEQICNDTGDDYGTCVCLPPDAGVAVDAADEIDAPEQVDAPEISIDAAVPIDAP